MSMNTQIFVQMQFAIDCSSMLVGCVIDDSNDLTENNMWKDALISEVFSSLEESYKNFRKEGIVLTLLHNDKFGRTVATEVWRFSEAVTDPNLTICRSVRLKSGNLMHCVEAKPFDVTKSLRVLLDRRRSPAPANAFELECDIANG